MKLKDVTEAYLENLLQNGDDYTLVGEYIDFIRELKARISNCTLSYADQMQLKADLLEMEI